ADIGKAPRQVADVVDEPEGLLDHDDAGVVSGLVRLCEIGGDLRAAAGKRDDPALDATGIGHDAGYVRHRPSPSLEWEADNSGRRQFGHSRACSARRLAGALPITRTSPCLECDGIGGKW